MSKLAARCAMHDKDCPIADGADGPMLISAGFSCKSVSPLNPHRKIDGNINVIRHASGSTGSTFKGVYEFSLEHGPPLQILENVPNLLNLATDNLANIIDMYNQAGFSIKAVVGDARDHGATMERARAFFFALHRKKCGLTAAEADDILADAVKMFKAFKIAPVRTADELLLPDTHPAVVKELLHFQQVKSDDKGKDKDKKWPDVHMQKMSSIGLPASSLRLPDEVRASPWFAILSPREKEVLSMKVATQPNCKFIEVSQSMGWGCRSASSATGSTALHCDDLCCALVPRSEVWITDRKRLLTGVEHCRFMCFPTKEMGIESEGRPLLVDLAGNAFNAASFLACLTSLFSSLPETLEVNLVAADSISDDEVLDGMKHLVNLFDDDHSDDELDDLN